MIDDLKMATTTESQLKGSEPLIEKKKTSRKSMRSTKKKPELIHDRRCGHTGAVEWNSGPNVVVTDSPG